MPAVLSIDADSSPSAVNVAVTNTGGGGAVTMSRATLLAGCAQGPLKAFLLSLSDTAWQALRRSKRLLVDAYATGAAGTTVTVVFSTGPILSVELGGAGNATIRLKFMHSTGR